jgi:hypothetical protein
MQITFTHFWDTIRNHSNHQFSVILEIILASRVITTHFQARGR